MGSRKKVVIVGGGFGGLNAAKRLGNSECDVLLIDRLNHHLFQPLLYQVASAALSPGDIAVPIREILCDYANISVIMGEVAAIDREKMTLSLLDGAVIGFDYLIAAVGAKHAYFGHPEWERAALGLKTLNDALIIREKILISFEKAERCETALEAQYYLNFLIVGGGPTGVEMAGAIAEIAYETMLKNFRKIDVTKAKIYLVEGTPYLLPAFSPQLSLKAKSYLEQMGVVVITGKMVSQITDKGAKVGETFIPAYNILWAAGNQASPLLKSLQTPLDRQGRAIVERDLSIPGAPSIFVIGDAALSLDAKGVPLPGLAPVAIQQGRYVAEVIRKALFTSSAKNLTEEVNRAIRKGGEAKERAPFRYVDKGNLATIGKTKAVGEFGRLQFHGIFAWLAWCLIHIFYLIGFKNRFFVFSQWMFSFFTRRRVARLIYRSIITSITTKENEILPKE